MNFCCYSDRRCTWALSERWHRLVVWWTEWTERTFPFKLCWRTSPSYCNTIFWSLKRHKQPYDSLTLDVPTFSPIHFQWTNITNITINFVLSADFIFLKQCITRNLQFISNLDLYDNLRQWELFINYFIDIRCEMWDVLKKWNFMLLYKHKLSLVKMHFKLSLSMTF